MDGILLIDKPQGWTSHDVVNKLRKILNIQKIGHTGTLDPLATGLLIICIGKATKFVKFLTDHDKEYLAEITLGVRTNTDDITGKVLETKEITSINPESIFTVLEQFKGTIAQIPPVASAIKVNGKRAYEYIHKNQEEPVMLSRTVTISALNMVSLPVVEAGKATFSIAVSCSKGTYIRSLARDIGQVLDYPATLSNLRRTKVGMFSVQDTYQLEDINTNTIQLLDPINYLGFPTLKVQDEWLFKVSNGTFLPLELFSNLQDTIVADKFGNPLAIYSYDEARNIMRLSVLL